MRWIVFKQICFCAFYIFLNGGICRSMTLEEKIGTVEAHLLKNEMTSTTATAGALVAKSVSDGWSEGVLAKASHPPKEGVSVCFQYNETDTFDGVSLKYTADGVDITVKQTFCVILVAFQNQVTNGLDNTALATLITLLVSTKLNAVTDRTFSFDAEVEGYKTFKMTTAADKKTDDWQDDIVALIKDQTVYFITSKRQKVSCSDVNNHPKWNKVWFNKLNYDKSGKPLK